MFGKKLNLGEIKQLCLNVILKFNLLKAELIPICHLLALLDAHHILHVSRIRVNILLCWRAVEKPANNRLTLSWISFDVASYLTKTV